MNQAEAFCRHRLEGRSVQDAAELADYASCPSPTARALWMRVQALNGAYDRDATERLKRRLDSLQVKFERLREDVQDAAVWLRASKIVDEHRR